MTYSVILPAFNLDQLALIHALVFEGALGRSELLQRMMEMRVVDLMKHAALALTSLGMHQFAQERITQMLEMDTRSRQWLSNWLERHSLMGLPGFGVVLDQPIHSNSRVVGGGASAWAGRGSSMRSGKQGNVRFDAHEGDHGHGIIGPCGEIPARTPLARSVTRGTAGVG